MLIGELETAEAMLRQRTGATSLDADTTWTDPRDFDLAVRSEETSDRNPRRIRHQFSFPVDLGEKHTGPKENGRVSFDKERRRGASVDSVKSNVQDPFSGKTEMQEQRRGASVDSVKSEPKGPLAPRSTRGGSPGSVAATSTFEDVVGVVDRRLSAQRLADSPPGGKAKSWAWKRTTSKVKSKGKVRGGEGEGRGRLGEGNGTPQGTPLRSRTGLLRLCVPVRAEPI